MRSGRTVGQRAPCSWHLSALLLTCGVSTRARLVCGYGDGVPSRAQKKSLSAESPYKVGPVLLASFLFVVVGSAMLQIIRVATENNAPPQMQTAPPQSMAEEM